MKNETITAIEDVTFRDVNYARITTTADCFVVTLDMGLKVSNWLANGHEYRSQKSILKTARTRRMADNVVSGCEVI